MGIANPPGGCLWELQSPNKGGCGNCKPHKMGLWDYKHPKEGFYALPFCNFAVASVSFNGYGSISMNGPFHVNMSRFHCYMLMCKGILHVGGGARGGCTFSQNAIHNL